MLVAYIMKPKAGYDYLATAAHFAAESSTGTNVNVCTTDDFTKSVDALVYYIDPDNEEMKIAYPTLLFDRNITDGRGMMCSFLTLAIGNNQGSLTARQLDNTHLFIKLRGIKSLRSEKHYIVSEGTFDTFLVIAEMIPAFHCHVQELNSSCRKVWVMWSTARSTTSTCHPHSSGCMMAPP